jgi:hypothetical protein
MEAGRELDALVAGKVMGLREVWASDREHFHHTVHGSTALFREPVPRYSTDITAAWEVVCIVRLRNALVGECRIESDGDTWSCSFGRLGYGDCGGREWQEDYGAEADTLPLAICLAALKAVTV